MIADMICYPWTVNWKVQGQDIEEFKYFKRWREELAARPAVQRGMAVGADFAEDQSKLSQEEKDRRAKMLYVISARGRCRSCSTVAADPSPVQDHGGFRVMPVAVTKQQPGPVTVKLIARTSWPGSARPSDPTSCGDSSPDRAFSWRKGMVSVIPSPSPLTERQTHGRSGMFLRLLQPVDLFRVP